MRGHPRSESIGQRLRRLRLERGLSQRELAAPGVSYAYISRIEGGTRQPSVKALRMLARKLGVSAEYLETGLEVEAADERELRLADAELALRLSEDPSRSEQLLVELLDEAIEAGDATAALRSRIALGLAATSQGRHTDAIARLKEAIDSGGLSPVSRPDVFSALGRTYVALGMSQQAVELFERCLDEIREQAPEDAAAEIRFATYLSYALTNLGELGRAQAVLGETLEHTDALVDPYTRVRLYWSLGRRAGHQGQLVAALGYLRRAIALLEATDDTVTLARAHIACGWILISQKKGLQAGAHLELADRLLGPRPDAFDLASLRTEQALRSAHLGQADEAIERARESLELLGEDGDPGERGRALWAFAEGVILKGDPDTADMSFRNAVDLLSGQGRWREAAQACQAWGKLLRRMGREKEALDALERAADLAVRGSATTLRLAH